MLWLEGCRQLERLCPAGISVSWMPLHTYQNICPPCFPGSACRSRSRSCPPPIPVPPPQMSSLRCCSAPHLGSACLCPFTSAPEGVAPLAPPPQLPTALVIHVKSVHYIYPNPNAACPPTPCSSNSQLGWVRTGVTEAGTEGKWRDSHGGRGAGGGEGSYRHGRGQRVGGKAVGPPSTPQSSLMLPQLCAPSPAIQARARTRARAEPSPLPGWYSCPRQVPPPPILTGVKKKYSWIWLIMVVAIVLQGVSQNLHILQWFTFPISPFIGVGGRSLAGSMRAHCGELSESTCSPDLKETTSSTVHGGRWQRKLLLLL